MSLDATLTIGLRGTHAATSDVTSRSESFGDLTTWVKRLTSGTGADQADLMFADTRTLAASATENLDLAGSLTDAFGATLAFAKIKAIIVQAAAANTNDVVVGGAASNAFTGPLGGTDPTVAARPGGAIVLFAPATGWTVTAGTGDILKVANSSSGTSVTYSIVIIGTSA